MDGVFDQLVADGHFYDPLTREVCGTQGVVLFASGNVCFRIFVGVGVWVWVKECEGGGCGCGFR